MEQGNYNTNTKKNKHILEKDRITIKQMLNAGCKRREIARVIGCSERRLRREILRGTWARLNSDDTISHVYSFDVGELSITRKDLLRVGRGGKKTQITSVKP